ncbi:hypothetical protein ACIBI9_50635 [Nonomuraea sp. NPDC050451]|uniref:hypothetical protein n=1 Tax=Nonomuraea sp. NPDC050451 TaxID=3364364 RepID=UPI0037B64A3F
MVELVRVGRSPEELAKEFQPSAQSIRVWVRQADLDGGRRADGLTWVERLIKPSSGLRPSKASARKSNAK